VKYDYDHFEGSRPGERPGGIELCHPMQKLLANEITHKPHYFLPAKASDSERMAVLMTKLLRGHNLMGNPFLKIVYANP
jgi:hypothetical protein